ncbi:DUF1345 domain-containing protein [Sphingomonas immobilis]|uniref:DUF1345 domain-containing protein n=1 Tax=Sphingomonas immobilis TaxID=3063997 RepID=A0ABT9A4P4_9SPHN|nr:DUF1345 domain-containing protein [Sphingomonas sp. CA1-15]MDO7843936.1 DUF1345 domain-containing protein [Sphingomonas sp. CA1-15]
MTIASLGRSIAPPRFVAFGVVLIAGLAAAIPTLGWSRGIMAAFDVAALVFLILVSRLLEHGEAAQMRKASIANDANRAGLLVITGVTMVAILAAVFKEMHDKDSLVIALVLATLVLSWLFSNTIYALHYAHLFYIECDKTGTDKGGIEIPECKEPDYWDFLYFSFTLGMTFQTSDVDITSRRMRRVVLGQCLAAFVFNLGVLAFTINTLGGGK